MGIRTKACIVRQALRLPQGITLVTTIFWTSGAAANQVRS